MREIKFRGMLSSYEWVFGLLTILKKDCNYIKNGCYISNKIGMPFAYEVRPETIGQYTGLKDKNGKEIYEGDIVKIKMPGWDELSRDVETTVLVEFKNVGFYPFNMICKEMINFENHEQGMIFTECLNEFNDYSCEVIGNVYQNPELLKGE